MKYRFFLLLLIAWLMPLNTYAEKFHAEQLTDEIKEFVSKELRQQADFSDDYTIVISNLDPRLQLEQCSEPLNMRLASQLGYATSVSVKVSCRAPKPWAIYVPAHVQQFAEVTVVSRNLSSGTIITEQDLIKTRMNIASAGNGFIVDANRALGKQLKRSLGSGQAIKLSHLKEPKIVKRGDKVVLEAANTSVRVVTSGQALAAGQIGEQIQVRNDNSDRIVDATVIAPGRVRVIF